MSTRMRMKKNVITSGPFVDREEETFNQSGKNKNTR